ncbi:MAG: DUF927 domain-containing protein [Desulfovibrio sp.]|jgi:putative DNA primase/helicase|nr:DUF927 domain-containing protein [Desulfovibrio sp.]
MHGLSVVAFDAGNLSPVAETARQRYADRKIIICADNDIRGNGENAGLLAATKAAEGIDAFLAVPVLKIGDKCDFNDLHCIEGKDAVWRHFQKAEKPEENAMPEGYSLRMGGKRPGLYHTEVREEGEPVETWLCGPVEVLAMTRDRESTAWGLLLRWKDADNVAHVWPMPRALLAGRDASAWLGNFADGGLPIAYPARARNLLNAFFMSCRTKRRALCVNRCGWHGGVYVFPDVTLKKNSPGACFSSGPTGQTGQRHEDNGLCLSGSENGHSGKPDKLDKPEETIVLQGTLSHNPFTTSGNLEGWRQTVGRLARENSRLAFAVCASLAGALLEPSGMESGGFNLIGGSSIGKTTALVATGSVWGKGSSAGGYVLNWRATANGLEGLAALHSDAALCLDELGQINGQVAESVAYMLGGGTGKIRASTDGNARIVRNWRVMVLSTGEMSLADKIREANGMVRTGQLVRLVDIPADAGMGFGLFENLHGYVTAQAFADAVKNAAAVSYGHAAREFIAAFLRQEAQTIYTAINEGMARLCPEDADGQVRRVARRFLLCAVAGEMAAEWGVLPWEQGDAFAAVKTCFEAWLSWRGGHGPAEDTAILAQVTLFIEQHGSGRFQDVNKPDAVCVNRVGFRLAESGRTLYFVLKESFKAEICKGFSPRHVASLLLDRGILLPGDSGSFTRKPSSALPEIGRKRCYTLVFEGEDNDLL